MNPQNTNTPLRTWHALMILVLLPAALLAGCLVGIQAISNDINAQVELNRSQRTAQVLMSQVTTADEDILIDLAHFQAANTVGDLATVRTDLQLIRQDSDLISRQLNALVEKRASVESFLKTNTEFADAVEKLVTEAQPNESSTSASELPKDALPTLVEKVAEIRRQSEETQKRTTTLLQSSAFRGQNAMIILAGVAVVLTGAYAAAVSLWMMRYFSTWLEVVRSNCDKFLQWADLVQPEPCMLKEINDIQREIFLASKALNNLNKRRMAFTEGAPDVILSIDSNLRIDSVSDSCTNRWGYSPDYLSRKSLIDLVKAEDVELVTSMFEKAKQQGSAEQDIQIRHRAGYFIDIRWSLTWNRKQAHGVAVAHDVTQQKSTLKMLEQQSQQQSSVIDPLPLAVALCKPDGVICGASRQVIDLVPNCPDPLVGRHFAELVPAASAQALWMEITSRLNRTVPLVFADPIQQTQTCLDVVASSFSLTEGRRYAVMFEDVSPRFEVEQFRQELASSINNDLRTPLNSMLQVLNGVPTGALGTINADGQKLAARCVVSGYGVIQLLNDLLDIERAAARRMHVQVTPVAWSEVMDTVLKGVESIANSSRTKLPQLAGDLPYVRADRDRLIQATTAITQVLLRCSETDGSLLVRARTTSPEDVELFLGMTGCRLGEEELADMLNPLANGERFQQLGLPFIRLRAPAAAALIKMMSGDLVPATVSGAAGYIIRLPKVTSDAPAAPTLTYK